ERPYYERGGGILLSQVRIAEKPAGEGALSVGLAAKEGADWSAIRWQNVDVGKDGTAKLEDLKPGIYRLLRVYRSSGAPATSRVPGRWQNNEVTITVATGKEVAVPLLRWVPAPAPRVKHSP